MSATVILGAGIIGTSTAYYLSKHQPPSSIHLVEASPELFASASGYAAGFLAKDWFSPAVGELGALSFDEHRKLAAKEDGAAKWGYSRSTATSLATSGSSEGTKQEKKEKVDVWCRDGGSRADVASGGDRSDGVAPPWLWTAEGDEVELISDEGTVAQLDPLRLCHFLLKKCTDAGVNLHHPAKAIFIQTDAVRNEVSSIRIADSQTGMETDVPCTHIIIAAGAWSPRVFETLFPRSEHKLPISSLAGHSLVVRSPRWGPGHEEQHGCHAVFLTGTTGYSPEIMSRIGGEIFVGGLNSESEPLPDLATDARGNISKSAIARLRKTSREVLGRGREAGDDDDDDLEIVREALCFRPVTDSGLPIVGRIPDEMLGTGVSTRPGAGGGVYLAAGHGPWGISLSLGTGKVLAEIVQGRQVSADVGGVGVGVGV